MSDENQPVLVATDFSLASDEALRQAALWAEQHRARLVVCHAVSRWQHAMLEHDPARDVVRERVEALLGGTPKGLEIALLEGSAAAVLKEADRRDASLLVIGPGDSSTVARVLLGSTAEQLLRYAPCSVLVARPSPRGPVLTATDFSDEALPAIEAGAREASQRGTDLVLLHSVHEPTSPLSALAPMVFSPPRAARVAIEERSAAAQEILETALSNVGATGRVRVAEGAPALRIVEAAREVEASLVCVASRGGSSLRRLALGSEAEAVARKAPCSVLVVRTDAPD